MQRRNHCWTGEQLTVSIRPFSSPAAGCRVVAQVGTGQPGPGWHQAGEGSCRPSTHH